jgi:hypothetical protein
MMTIARDYREGLARGTSARDYREGLLLGTVAEEDRRVMWGLRNRT